MTSFRQSENVCYTGLGLGTGVARNFGWRAKLEKNCDVILKTFFGDVMVMMSQK